PQMQHMAAVLQHFVRKIDTEPIPTIPDAVPDELWAVVVCNRCDQGDVAIGQLESDALPGCVRVPDPAVDRGPIYGVYMTFQFAVGLQWHRCDLRDRGALPCREQWLLIYR